MLRISADGLAWQSKQGGQEVVNGSDLRAATWLALGRTFQLKLALKGGSVVKFDGFPPKTYDFLVKFFRDAYHVDVATQAVSKRGWNWGEVQVVNNMLQFDVENERAFELPLADVTNVGTSHAMRANKHELSLELQQSDTFGGADTLVELKLYVPPKTGKLSTAALDEDGEAAVDDDDADDDAAAANNAAGKGKEKTRAQELTEQIKARANTSSASATPIVTFKDVLVVTPRAKCDLTFYGTHFDMVSVQRSFTVLYSHVVRLLTLSKPDGRAIIFIVSLDPPILQGHTTYPHLVINIPADEVVDRPVTLQNELRVKYGDLLGTEIKGPLLQALGLVFHAFTQKKPITSVKDFKSGTVSHVVETDEVDAEGNVTTKRKEVQTSAIRCIYKTNAGLLYPLANSFFFVYKPPLYIRHDEIDNIEFASSETQRNFDVIFNMKSGASMLFSSLQRPDFKPFYEFLRSKNIAVKSIEQAQSGPKRRVEDDDDDDDDDDGPIDDGDGFNVGGSESEDEDFEDKGVTEEVSEEYATPDESLDGDAAAAAPGDDAGAAAAAAAGGDDDDDDAAAAGAADKKKKKKRAEDADEDSAARAARKKAKKEKKAAKKAAAAAAAGDDDDEDDE